MEGDMNWMLLPLEGPDLVGISSKMESLRICNSSPHQTQRSM